MSNLTPEKRVDKNGRLVTKHVKTGAVPGANMSSVPAPSLPETKRKSDPLALLAPVRGVLSQSGIKACSKFLRECKDSTRAVATDAVDDKKPFTSEIMGLAVTKVNEGFLLVVASSSREWSSIAKYKMGDSEYLKSGEASNMIGKMWDAYSAMTTYNTTNLYRTLSHEAAEDFNPEESIESFRMEYLGQQLELDTHTRTKREYYRSVETLNNDIDGVIDAMPILMGINKNLVVTDQYGYEVGNSLNAEQIMSVVQMSKDYPERIDSLVGFIKQRHTYDEDAVREFLETDATALSSGIL
jgi:hypothetical protein